MKQLITRLKRLSERGDEESLLALHMAAPQLFAHIAKLEAVAEALKIWIPHTKTERAIFIDTEKLEQNVKLTLAALDKGETE